MEIRIEPASTGRYGTRFENFHIHDGPKIVGDCQIERRMKWFGEDPIYFLHIVLHEAYQRCGVGKIIHDLVEQSQTQGRFVPAQYLSQKCERFWWKRAPHLMEERKETREWQKWYAVKSYRYPPFIQQLPRIYHARDHQPWLGTNSLAI